MKNIIILISGLMIATLSYSQKNGKINIDSIIDEANIYFDQARCEEALDFLSEALLKRHSASDIHRISDLMLNCYFTNSQFDKMLDIMSYGHNHGVVYRIHPFFKDSLKDNPSFIERLNINDSLLLIEREKAEASYELVYPDNYDKEKKYPLFIVLTKGARTRKVLIDGYRSPRIKKEFIVAFLHSSDFRWTNFYQWHNEKERRPEIENIFHEIINNYNIDTSKIVIGGMSNAGQMAIDMTFRSEIPIKGFIAFCPTNANITGIEISKANKRGVKGLIAAGINDTKFLKHAEDMKESFKKNKFMLIYEVGNFDHRIPVRLSKNLHYMFISLNPIF